MKNSKKLLALELAVLMLIALFTGCGTTSDTPAASASPASPNQAQDCTLTGASLRLDKSNEGGII